MLHDDALLSTETFKAPKVKEGEKPPEGKNFDDLPVAEVRRLALLAMKKRLSRGETSLPRAHC